MAGQTCTQQGVSCANPDYFNAAGFADKKEPGTATVGNCCDEGQQLGAGGGNEFEVEASALLVFL